MNITRRTFVEGLGGVAAAAGTSSLNGSIERISIPEIWHVLRDIEGWK